MNLVINNSTYHPPILYTVSFIRSYSSMEILDTHYLDRYFYTIEEAESAAKKYFVGMDTWSYQIRALSLGSKI